MTPFSYDFEDDGNPILIEVTETTTKSKGGSVGDTGLGDKVKEGMIKVHDDLMKTAYRNIYRFARYTTTLIKKVREAEDSDVPLKQVEIEFGIKFIGETHVLIGKAGGESQLNVRMTWERGE